jgi:hypothetical protein
VFVIVSHSILSDNTGPLGGGIFNFIGTVTVEDSYLTGNSATGGDGGGIWNNGTLTVSRSNLSDNSAMTFGGGISNYGSLLVADTEFCHNSPDDISGPYVDQGGNSFCESGSNEADTRLDEAAALWNQQT